MQLTKSEVARRQLGTALSIFVSNHDPISVHVLACGAGEIANHLSKKAEKPTFSLHLLSVNPDLDEGGLKALRNRYWNAFKHATTQGGKDRDDDEILQNFRDDHNDHVLFIGWYDYMRAVECYPVGAQVFQLWYFGMYPDKVNSAPAVAHAVKVFGKLQEVSRQEAKRRLRLVIQDYENDQKLLANPRTDKRPLII